MFVHFLIKTFPRCSLTPLWSLHISSIPLCLLHYSAATILFLSQSCQCSLIPNRCRFSSLTGVIPLECSPLVIIECSVCVCLELAWKRVFCWLAPGGCTKKEQGILKEECKKPGWSFLYDPVPLDRHTQTMLMEQQGRRPHNATLRGTQDSNPPSPCNTTKLSCHVL